MDDATLQAAADRLPWFHSMELRPGVVTKGAKSRDLLASEADAVLGPLDLAGRSLLDIGAWNGFWSFEAKRRGAGRVVALDDYTWRHPDFRGRETFDLARAALGLEVEAVEADVTALAPDFGRFDAVLFLGVFYHLEDPLPVFRTLRALTGQALVLETHQAMLDCPQPAMVYYPGKELAGDETNWWGPNPALVYRLLVRAGFARVFYQDHPAYGRARGIFHAFPEAAPGSVLPAVPPHWADLNAPGALASLVVGGRSTA